AAGGGRHPPRGGRPALPGDRPAGRDQREFRESELSSRRDPTPTMAGAGLMWRWWTCRRLRGRLVDLDSGALPPAERTRVELHVATCGGRPGAPTALRRATGVVASGEPPCPRVVLWRWPHRACMREVRPRPAAAPATPGRH